MSEPSSFREEDIVPIFSWDDLDYRPGTYNIALVTGPKGEFITGDPNRIWCCFFFYHEGKTIVLWQHPSGRQVYDAVTLPARLVDEAPEEAWFLKEHCGTQEYESLLQRTARMKSIAPRWIGDPSP